jgi:hypothetical protein
MLALKVHKTKVPNIRRGSFWIPIVDWRSARIHLRNWYKTMSRRGPVRYVSLISIPKDHPVIVLVDFTSRLQYGFEPKDFPFVPLREVEQSTLGVLKPLEQRLGDGLHYLGQGFFVSGSVRVGEPPATYPELILGADLPPGHVKWTKDIRLLTRDDTRTRLRNRTERAERA